MIKKIRLIWVFLLIFLYSCGNGGNSSAQDFSIPEKPPILISYSAFPDKIFSFQTIDLEITSNYLDCSYSLSGSDIHWISSSGNSFRFNAPITTLSEEDFKFDISSIPSNECPYGFMEVNINVEKRETRYNDIPINNLNLKTNYYHVSDIGFGGLEIQETYSATVCYPTENDCVTYENELFGQDAHNIATGDFNGDGFEDFVVAWAIFPHTIDQSKKIYGPINIYLNDQNGGFAEDLNLYAESEPPSHPFAYRLVVDDLNGDGLDDIFAGSMGLSVEQGTSWGIDPYPHFLMLSNSLGKFEESSANIIDENNGMGQLCRFAHDASGGDPDGDGDIDLFACNMLLVNDGKGNFNIHPYLNLNWHHQHASPMSSLLADLNNDGFDDVMFWNFNDRWNFDQMPEEGFTLLSNGTSDIQDWKKIAIPPGPFGINETKYNHAAKGDFNNDGFMDVAIGVTRATPYYEGAYVQVLINDGSGNLVDETDARFPNQERVNNHHGESNIYVRDMNFDGALDIIHSTRDFLSGLHGAHVAINDGAGNFRSLPDSTFPNRPVSFNGNNETLFKGVPIDADKLGCLDLISTTDSWQDASTTRNYLFSILNTDCSY